MTTENPNPNETNVEEFVEEPEEGGLSLSQLDVLLVNDPEFVNKVAEITADTTKSEPNIELVDIEKVIRASNGNSFKARRQRFKLYLRSKLIIVWIHFKSLAVTFFSYLLESIKTLGSASAKGLKQFRYLPLKKKLSLSLVALLGVGTSYYIYRAARYGWLNAEPPLFVKTLEEWSVEKKSYDADHDMESFYESSRVAQNLFSLKRIVVNIRRSENSGPNPMAAFEFYLEGSSTEAVVEVKDRESELRDRIQRSIEEMSYDQLASTDGKQLLIEKLRRELNKLLTSGQIRRVLFKSIVVKP